MKRVIKSDSDFSISASEFEEELVKEGFDKDIVHKVIYFEFEYLYDDELEPDDQRSIRKACEKASLYSSRRSIKSRRFLKSAMDDETMWDAFEDIKNTLFETLSGMSWLSKKGSRLDSLCEDLTAQIIGFEMDRDPSDILNEYLSW